MLPSEKSQRKMEKILELLYDLHETEDTFQFAIAMSMEIPVDDTYADQEGFVCVSRMAPEMFQYTQDRMLSVYLKHENIDVDDEVTRWTKKINDIRRDNGTD